MNINLDEKRILRITYALEDGSVVDYGFKNGEICDVKQVSGSDSKVLSDREMIDRASGLNFGKYKNRIKNMLSDSEMIDKIRNSEFMDELEDARKRFKISKEIVDTFPEKDKDSGYKKINRRYSDESLKTTRELIKMDEDGRLDEIVRKHNGRALANKPIDEYVKLETKKESEDQYDLDVCNKNLNKIEEKILRLMRSDENEINTEEFKTLLDDYNSYKTKKKELDKKVWDNMTKCKG